MAKTRRINIPSVRNSTRSQVPAPTGSRFPTVPPPESASPEPDSPKNPNKNAVSEPGLLNPLKSLNGESTTTTVVSSVVEKEPSSPSSAIAEFHQRLSNAFASARKPLPLPEQSAIAYAEAREDREAFLLWLPTSKAFIGTRTPGGLPALVRFFKADKETRPAVDLDSGHWPGALFDNRIHWDTWQTLTAAEREKWRRHKPLTATTHVDGCTMEGPLIPEKFKL